ncbi:MAG: dethiobiotin synthase [Gammaproteobacteria bacterium]
MKQGYFITGTDTHIGKTWTAVALMRFFKKKGKSVAGMKPVASGCHVKNDKLFNEDALLIKADASIEIDYDLINPYAYRLPTSPHLADPAHPVNLDHIIAAFNRIKTMAEIVVVEGAGGWYAPINDSQDISDLAKALELPVIIVVAIRLGCINHAKLTVKAVKDKGVDCAGWIAVCSDPEMLKINETIESLKKELPIPLLGILPYLETADFDLLAEHLDW